MVNASLNWASIVGIVLAVGGALLYFMRSFKPALARDYDVFFAAIGLLCGGILFFQGWRLDPILQFGQFLLAGTTVFFAYESVRLRGVTTEQARRSSFFDDEEPVPARGRGGLGPSRDWDSEPDRFDEPGPVRPRFRGYDEPEDDFYRPRRTSRAAIPERAASRRESDDWEPPRREDRDRGSDRGADRAEAPPSRYAAGASRAAADFGSRRREREAGSDARRGSRPSPSTDNLPRSSRRPDAAAAIPTARASTTPPAPATAPRPGAPAGIPQGTPTGRSSRPTGDVTDADFSPVRSGSSGRPAASPGAEGTTPANRGPSVRDNTSRFDD